MESVIRGSLDGIRKNGYHFHPFNIEPKIHRMVVSGEYGIKFIREHLGKVYTNKNFIPEDRMPNYQKMHFWNYPKFRLDIFTEPIKPGMPLCYIEIHPRGSISMDEYKGFLLFLNKTLPDLKVSKVEYANDHYCVNQTAARDIFEIYKRFLYIPYARMLKLWKGDSVKIGKNVSMNFTYEAGDIKVYERGMDKDKKDEGWEREKVDRVRLEYTARRSKLKKNGINSLNEFINSPKFFQVNKGINNFKYFQGSKKLPQWWEEYGAEDDSRNIGIFQLEYIHQKKKVNNIGQYKKDKADLNELKSSLEDGWKKFDQEWEALKVVPISGRII